MYIKEYKIIKIYFRNYKKNIFLGKKTLGFFPFFFFFSILKSKVQQSSILLLTKQQILRNFTNSTSQIIGPRSRFICFFLLFKSTRSTNTIFVSLYLFLSIRSLIRIRSNIYIGISSRFRSLPLPYRKHRRSTINYLLILSRTRSHRIIFLSFFESSSHSISRSIQFLILF